MIQELLPGALEIAVLAGEVLHSPALLLFPSLVILEVLYLFGAWLAVLCCRRRSGGAPVLPGLPPLPSRPSVSCLVTCYSEGAVVERTILSLLDQDYAGLIEVLPVIDGAAQNRDTLCSALGTQSLLAGRMDRRLRIVPKWIRGGRPSSLNAGLSLATGDIVLALDGDTSFDRDMITRVVAYFGCPGVIAVAGTLRVRNCRSSLLTRLQSLDYLVFRQFVRAGLGLLNVVNNVPGAHGAFRADVLRAVGGWDNGTAEDVDLALRLKKYFAGHRGWRILAAPDVISHTDVPAGWKEFLAQRLRWEGDPFFLHFRKHGPSLRRGLMGWRNALFVLWYGVVFQVLMPPMLLLGLVLLLISPYHAAALMAFSAAYGFYLLMVALLFLTHLGVTSERRRNDMRLAGWLVVYPFFVFLVRGWSGLAVFHNLLVGSHRDSAMAPWWVLRRGRF